MLKIVLFLPSFISSFVHRLPHLMAGKFIVLPLLMDAHQLGQQAGVLANLGAELKLSYFEAN